MSFTSSEYRQLLPLLKSARTAVVLTHIQADGDGVGSGLALTRYLQARGITACFLTADPLPLSLQFLSPDGEAALYNRDDWSRTIRESDLIFTVDNSSVSRLGPLAEDVRNADGHTICIDHHLVRNEFWNLNLIDQDAGATGEMIYRMIRELGGKVDRPMAEALYVAIVTDTGRFRFSKTSPAIHRIAAELLELGVSPSRVHQEINERNSPAFMRLLAESLRLVQYSATGRLAWLSLPSDVIACCQAEEEDTSEVINQMLSVDGVEIALLLREIPGDGTKISLRSKPQYDVNVVAVANGGGGHKNAAGAVVDLSLADCSSKLVAEAEALLR